MTRRRRLLDGLRPQRARIPLLFGAWLGVVGCASSAADSAALATKVHVLVGNAACTSDEQCRTLPYGAKACGGPQSYLAWSTAVSDEAALKAAAERYAAQRREELRASGLLSDCALVPDPGAVCAPATTGGGAAPRHCVLQGGNGGRGKAAL
jgi:hypothetical protein